MALIVSAFTVACGSQSDSTGRHPYELTAIEIALNSSAEEGILMGEPRQVHAARMTLEEAEQELTAWGAPFPEFVADYPPPGTLVWVVGILGEGVQPGPPREPDRGLECIDIRVIVLEEQQEELVLIGKPSEDC